MLPEYKQNDSDKEVVAESGFKSLLKQFLTTLLLSEKSFGLKT